VPYNIRKRKCKRSDGGSGSYTMTYTDKKGKHHSNCHRSKKSARAQIGAIEMKESMLRELIREQILESVDGLFEENFEACSHDVATGEST
jgi:hypothetical protein